MSGEWRGDPSGMNEYRWWGGKDWTDQVANRGQVSVSPLGDRPAQPELQGQPPAPTGPTGPTVGITGALIDGSFAESEAQPIANQNSKMLRVRVGEPFMARQGSMVAYQGSVKFEYEGGGAAKFLKKVMTGQGLSLMKVSGQGDVFLADLAHDVHVLDLNQSGISISGKNVLAFSAGLDWDVERVKGGGIAAGGLFNTTVRGSGWVAIATDGPPVVLNTGEAPTFVDTDAVVAWSAELQASLQNSLSAGLIVGRGSGEAFQITFNGTGFVIVQPSEGFPMSQA